MNADYVGTCVRCGKAVRRTNYGVDGEIYCSEHLPVPIFSEDGEIIDTTTDSELDYEVVREFREYDSELEDEEPRS